ncbi:kinase-like protein, partial [Rozella allomycis CSF55]
MEHIPGFDLGSFANQYDPVDKENFLEHFKINYTFDLDKIREIAAKCVLALEHLKAARLISRDIKPGNIMVDNGKIKLIDFNASVMKKDEDIKRMGTLFFIAPELASTPSRLDYSTSSDIFSLGVTLYHL